MIRDVFYFGNKPNVHPREKFVNNIQEARKICSTEHFWIINEFCDYKNFDWDFDFDFLPDDIVWHSNHNNVWPSQHCKDSGTWLCSKNDSDVIIYRDDVKPVYRKKIKTHHWKELYHINQESFDFSWHPDPTSPPYIYVWGCRYFPSTHGAVLEYHVEGATQYKFMDQLVELLPNWNNWKILQEVDKQSFDFSWHPDPTNPPYIYVWGNQHYDAATMPTIEYHVPNATQKHYIDNQLWHIKLKQNPDLFVHYEDCNGIDYSWRPNPNSLPYIYVWGNQWNKPEDKISVEFRVEGATEYKYMLERAKRKPNKEHWFIPDNIDDKNFDYSWEPNPNDPPYVYEFGTQWQKTGGPKFIVKNATETKYIDIQKVKILPSLHNWTVPNYIDSENFDFSWHPDNTESPYIYEFATIWNNRGGPIYNVLGATEIKYIEYIKAKTLPNKSNFKINVPLTNDGFDFSWVPHPQEPPYIYIFGNQWNDAQKESTIEYHVPNATEFKYVTNIVAKVSENKDKFEVLIPIEENGFDFSWRPDPNDPPYIYVFGNQWNSAEIEPTVRYYVENATEYKYINQIKATVTRTGNWKTLIPVDEFDYSWRPNPREPAFIYVFGNKWNDAATEPTIQYEMEGATGYKYMDFPVATPKTEMKNWSIGSNNIESFDFTWRPNPYSPPQIYQWEDNGPRYTVPGATEVVYMKLDKVLHKQVSKYYIKTTLIDLINEHTDEVFWALNSDINYSNFDFKWKPDENNFRHINVFGSQYSKDAQTYYVNGPMYQLGYREFNYIEDQKVIISSTNLTMFFIDKGNTNSEKHFQELKIKFPELIKTRYLNSWVDTISRCIKKSKTKLFWVLNSEYDYSDFVFDFYPSPWQLNMIHVFGTQWSHWGHTYLINSETFIESTKYIKTIEHLNCLNFVRTIKAKAVECLYDIYLIDFGNIEKTYILTNFSQKYSHANITVVPYNKNYLQTFKDICKIASDKNDNFIWVGSTVCNYDKFDFTYIADPFARDQLHVFPSNNQKYGDTFLVNLTKLREQSSTLNFLNDYEKINFNSHQKVYRFKEPEIVTNDDTLSEIIQTSEFDFPYAVFKTSDNKDIECKDEEPMSLWSETTKNIIVTSTGASRVIIPKEAKHYVKQELYDYPFIIKKIKKESKPLDIVFLSNGEMNADENYEHLLSVTKGLPNRIVRVDGVNGRVNAYHAAANASKTNWLFTVFAKLKVSSKFDWSWQPDRLSQPKHYIFYAENPVNGLVYGHQAMIAYNKKLTLKNEGKGLDFTLDDLHDTVPILSGIAEFNMDPYSTWRTSFREVIKLKSDYEPISQERLQVWLSKAQGNFAEYSLYGAKDAVEYYDQVQGDIDRLKLSYEWKWLKDYFNQKYK